MTTRRTLTAVGRAQSDLVLRAHTLEISGGHETGHRPVVVLARAENLIEVAVRAGCAAAALEASKEDAKGAAALTSQ